MPSSGVVALVAALASLFAGLAVWRSRRGKAAEPKEIDRAWDLHARRSAAPPEPPAGNQKKPAAKLEGEASAPQKAPPGKPGSKAPESKPAGKAPESKPAGKAPESKPAGKSAPPKPAGKSAPPKPAGKSAPPPPVKSTPPKAPPGKPVPPAKIPAAALPDLLDDDDDDLDLTIVTLGPLKVEPKLVTLSSDDLEEEDDDDEPVRAGAVPIVYDADAALDEPTQLHDLILVSSAGQTDRGQRRHKNEDSYAILESHGIFIVADGMGGHSGGEVASKIAVDTITDAFKKSDFSGELYPGVPRRGSELAVAIQRANQAIYERSRKESQLAGMGTTVVSARFSPNKQRVYIGHVGDSRCYRLRGGDLKQITTDHTMGAAGLTGPLADRLERAVGIGPAVKVDVIITRPQPEDVYLLCSDGLSKMVPAAQMRDILMAERELNDATAKLIARANQSGGKDNITVILVKVTSPGALARALQEPARAPKK